MAKRLFQVPTPLLGDEEYLLVSFCIPDSPDWRRLIVGHIDSLSYGRAYDGQTGYIKGAQDVGREIFASMSMCKLEDILKQQRILTAAIVGEQVDLTDPAQLSPDAVDYSSTSATPGLVPKIDQMLNVDRSLYADMNIAEVLFEGLIGRRVSVPIPFEGTGLADLADEQLTTANINLDTLHNRLRMTDSSLFNPLSGEKNITEALETLLRRDKLTDLEFLTPNLVTVLESLFQLDGGSAILGLISGLYEWITGEPLAEIPETATTAEILMLIANAKQTASTEPQPITVETTTNVTTTCKCGGSGCGGCGGGTEPPSEPAVEGDPPPEGWEPPTDSAGTEIVPGEPAYQSRKCKISNILHTQTRDLIVKINASALLKTGVETFGDSFVAMLTTSIGYIIGELATPFPVLDGLLGSLIGWLVGFVIVLIVGDVDLDELEAVLTDPNLQEDFVCGLYNGRSAEESINGYLQVLIDNEISFLNQEVIAWVMVPKFVNLIFFKNSDYSQEIEAALDGYTGAVDCACGNDLTYIFTYCGIEQGAFVSGDFNTQVVIDSVGTLHVCSGPEYQFVGLSASTPGQCLNFGIEILSGSANRLSYADCAGNPIDDGNFYSNVDAQSVHIYNDNNQAFQARITISTIP